MAIGKTGLARTGGVHVKFSFFCQLLNVNVFERPFFKSQPYVLSVIYTFIFHSRVIIPSLLP